MGRAGRRSRLSPLFALIPTAQISVAAVDVSAHAAGRVLFLHGQGYLRVGAGAPISAPCLGADLLVTRAARLSVTVSKRHPLSERILRSHPNPLPRCPWRSTALPGGQWCRWPMEATSSWVISSSESTMTSASASAS